MPRTLFTSDTHFGHALTTRLRGFETVRDQDEALIAAWNSVVAPTDIVWHLGDFSHRMLPDAAKHVFNVLHGSKHLILGNHDVPATRALPWASQHQIADIAVDGQRLILCHYAMRVWPGQHRGAIMLYGHSHGRLPGTATSLDVGVDSWGFAPIDLPMIRQRLAETADLAESDRGLSADEPDEGLKP